jgi:hypothetical protein
MRASLLQAATSTFEDLTFLLPTERLDERQAKAGLAAEARVDFAGPLTGTLLVRVHGELMPVLAARMLGATAPGPILERDALGEIANVLCGNVLPRIAGGAAVFSLRSPAVTNGIIAPAPPPAPTAAVTLGLDCGRIEVLLNVDPGQRA